MSKETTGSSASVLPSDILLRDFFDKHGFEATMEFLNQYLKQCEQGDYYISEYCLPTGPCSRSDFIRYNVTRIADPNCRMEAQISVEPIEEEDKEQPPNINELLQTDDLMGLLEKILTENPEEVEPNIQIHEDMMFDVLKQYRFITNEQRRMKTLKDQLTTRFAYHVNEWSHGRFENPNEDNKVTHQMYYALKWAHIRVLMPSLSKYKSLYENVDVMDTWINGQLMPEDGAFLGGTICNINSH